MRHRLLSLALCLVPAVLDAQFARARVHPPGYQTQLALDTIGLPHEIAAPSAKVYRAVVAAFEELKIPLGTRDSVGGMVGNLDLVRRTSLAGSQLSRWLNCGSGLTGPNADNWRVYLSIAALLDPLDANRTRLRIGMAGGAVDVQGNAKDPVVCVTTGSLEALLVAKITARAAAP